MLLARELPQVSVPEHFLALDVNSARINIEKAAYHGFAKAQVKMGAAYELCQLGCDFNPALSLHYNALAARQGEPDAEMAISKWFLCGHEGVFEKNDELAFTYAQRAAQSGLPTAEFALGYFYEVGIFVPVDIKEARSWYTKAAASGNKDASSRIESISRSKTLSRKDHEKVAIARIKSRYGSQGQQSSLEPAAESIEMPDPSKMSISDPPMSSAPYPDRPPSQARLTGQPGYQVNDPRPSSAFGINPNIRANGSQYAGQPQPQPNNRIPSYGAGRGGYRPAALASNMGTASPPMRSPTGTPKLDVGYSAPMEPPYRRQTPNMANPHGPADMNYHGPPDRRPARTPMSPHSQSGPPAHGLPSGPRPSGQQPSGAYPPRHESRPPPKSSSSSGTPNPPSTPKPAPQPAKAPPKGPKTFEEMGVPTVKNDGDCVSFAHSYYILIY